MLKDAKLALEAKIIFVWVVWKGTFFINKAVWKIVPNIILKIWLLESVKSATWAVYLAKVQDLLIVSIVNQGFSIKILHKIVLVNVWVMSFKMGNFALDAIKHA